MAAHLWSIGEAQRSGPKPEQSDSVGYSAGLAAWMFAAGTFVAVRGATDELPPWTFCFWRVFLAAILMYPLVWRHRKEMTGFLRERGGEAFLIGAFGMGMTQGLLFLALNHTSAVNTGIIFSTAPILTLILAGIVLREPVGTWAVMGSLFAFTGIVLIAVRGSIATLLNLDFGIGDLLVIGGAITFAGYTVSLKRAKFDLPRMPLLVILMTSGAIALFPFFIYELLAEKHGNLDTKGYAALGYAVIFGGVLLYLLYNRSVDALGASRAGALLYSQMVFTAVLAWLILGETIAWYHFAGGGLIVVGIVLVTLLKPKAAT